MFKNPVKLFTVKLRNVKKRTMFLIVLKQIIKLITVIIIKELTYNDIKLKTLQKAELILFILKEN